MYMEVMKDRHGFDQDVRKAWHSVLVRATNARSLRAFMNWYVGSVSKKKKRCSMLMSVRVCFLL